MKWIKQYGWLLISCGGIVLVIAGIACFVNPLTSYLRLVRYAGLGMLVNSVMLMTLSLLLHLGKAEKRWMIAKSLLDLFFALILCYNPLLTFIAFPLLAGFLILCSGLLKTAAALLITSRNVRPVSMITGLLFLVFGILLMRATFRSDIDINIILGLFGSALGSLYLFYSLSMHFFKPAVKAY
jgi:uncharacterized membrane protein HdeD (DUF308 family)